MPVITPSGEKSAVAVPQETMSWVPLALPVCRIPDS